MELFERIKNARKISGVNVPTWGGEVWLRTLSVGDSLDLEDMLRACNALAEGTPDKVQAYQNLTIRAIQCVVCNDRGEQVFKTREDVLAAPKDGLAAVAEAVMKHIGIAPPDAEVKN